MKTDIIDKKAKMPRRIFLIDGLGALLSASWLSGVLAKFEFAFGMPAKIVYMLAAAACVYAVYSFSCYFLLKTVWRPYLKIIIVANVLYCGVTIGSVCYFYKLLTILGLGYFILELIVIAVIVSIENRKLTKGH